MMKLLLKTAVLLAMGSSALASTNVEKYLESLRSIPTASGSVRVVYTGDDCNLDLTFIKDNSDGKPFAEGILAQYQTAFNFVTAASYFDKAPQSEKVLDLADEPNEVLYNANLKLNVDDNGNLISASGIKQVNTTMTNIICEFKTSKIVSK